MPAALIAALFFTVSLLVTHAYFLFGSLPLLVLEHETPMDARFVRGFFDTYFRAALFTAGATAISLAFAGRPALAGGAAALALLAALMRRTIIPKMDTLRARMQADEARAVTAFRRTHVIAILLDLAQLSLIVSVLIATSMR